MFDIVTIEMADQIVELAVKTVMNGAQGVIPHPGNNFRVVSQGEIMHTAGDGGLNSGVLVVVAHASANGLSGCQTWADYVKASGNLGVIPWLEKKAVYLVACSTAGEGNGFLHGNIATEVKRALPGAVVWASSSPVSAKTLSGDWQRL